MVGNSHDTCAKRAASQKYSGALSLVYNTKLPGDWYFCIFNPLPPSDAVRRQKKIEDLFSSILSHFKACHRSGNLKFNNLGIFQSLKLRILVEKILPISFTLNFTPNTFGCYGLTGRFL